MPILLLIRHGENDYLKKNILSGRRPGIHLNEFGQSQAADLVQSLGKVPLNAIYSSPLERAVETAQPMAQALGIEIQVRENLTDLDVGEWTGKSWKALRRTRNWKVIQESPSQFTFPGGESFLQAQKRICLELDEISRLHHEGLVAVFFHADPIKLAIAANIGLPLDKFQHLTIGTGSVSILQTGDPIKLLGMNLVPPFSFPLINAS